MRIVFLVALASFAVFAGCAATVPKPDRATLEAQVVDTERAFAKTMADRDHAAFTSFLYEEAVFFSGSEPLRGK